MSDCCGNGFRAQELVGVVVAAFEGHQITLHVGVGAAGVYGGDPQRRLTLAQ